MIKQILIFLLISSQAYAQLEQTKRYEVEVKRSDEGLNVISADSSGIFLFQETRNYDGRNKYWNLIYLDNQLEKQRENSLLINNRYNWIGHEYNAPYLYLLFRQGEVNTNDLHVIRVGAHNDAIEKFDIRNEIDFNITHFSVCRNSALMGGYVDNRPALILYNFIDEKIKVLPGFYVKDAQLIDITVNANDTFNVLISNEKNVSRKNLELKVYDPLGNLLADDAFTIPEGKDVMTGLTSRLKNENLIVTGTFGSNNSKLAEGIFWARADLSKEQSLKLIPFIDFNSIYDYLSEKRRVKMKKKAERKRANNRFFEKEHVYLHRIFENGGKYYLMLEIFDPYTQRNNQIAMPYSIRQQHYYLYPYSRFYSRLPNVYNVNEYSKIKYQQAIVAAMNEKGEVLWDESIVFDKKESERLQQISDITILNNKVAIAYKDEEELSWKIIDSGEANEDAHKVEVMMLDSTDVLRNEVEDEGGIRYWYDGVFYVWGYQSIKRRTDDGKNDRLDVFYINKMEVAE
jgi:hypothetical protein